MGALLDVKQSFNLYSKIIKAVHGNSRFSKRIHHGYEIYEIVNGKKRIVKVGISGAKLNKNGTSPRLTVRSISGIKKRGIKDTMLGLLREIFMEERKL
ncbi:hypothetical protein JCR24_14955 [Geobacillus sp. YHL]|nr:hypothetical protein [Geobacillus sp. YHL]